MLKRDLLCDALRQREISEQLWDIRIYDSIDSTNTEAKRLAQSSDDRQRLLLVAEEQTAGHGRQGRSFYSPKQTGLYFSLSIPLDRPVFEVLSWTSAASVAVFRAIRCLTGITCGIKWVNDLYIRDRKVVGILAESQIRDEYARIILGIGINLSTKDFPEELQDIAGCVDPTATLSREVLLGEILYQLEPYLLCPEDDSWLEDYRRHSIVLGRPVRWISNGIQKEGTAEEITSTGALLVRTDRGERALLSTGEITLRTL